MPFLSLYAPFHNSPKLPCNLFSFLSNPYYSIKQFLRSPLSFTSTCHSLHLHTKVSSFNKMSCFYLSVGLLAGHFLVFREQIMNSGCWYIWMHAHLERESWFPSKDTFFLTATEMQSTRQCSFQLNSNLRAIFCFNFATTPGGTWETCHSCLIHLKNRLAVTTSYLWPVPKHVDPACNTRHSVKSRWRGLSGLGVVFFFLLGFACQKPFCADI